VVAYIQFIGTIPGNGKNNGSYNVQIRRRMKL